jgi:hypothetical protein
MQQQPKIDVHRSQRDLVRAAVARGVGRDNAAGAKHGQGRSK